MTILAVIGDKGAAQAGALARRLGIPLHQVAVHRFPDGETLPIVPTGAERVVVYCSLDRPNSKILPLLQSADAWRRAGVDGLTLVAPYLPYMRQDAVFRSGEPLSRDVFAVLLRNRFDRVITVDPHLHRTRGLDVLLGPDSLALAAAPLLAMQLDYPDLVVVGPDSESRPWAGAVAQALGADIVVLSKQRSGDRDVQLDGDLTALRGRRAVIVDDVCSSGATMLAALKVAQAAGAASVDLAFTHALFGSQTERAFRAAGARRLIYSDSCRRHGASVRLNGLFAAALTKDFT